MAGIKYIPASDGKKVVNVRDGYNSDIIENINNAFFRAVSETRGAFSQQFKGSSRKATAFNVWSFLKNNVKYQKDPNAMQAIRLPGRLLQDKAGDCKSFAIISGAILKNLGFPVVLRYASYNSSPTPTHIYVVTFDNDGSPIIVDAVYNKFNAEPAYRSKRDYLMKIKSN